MHYLKLAFTCTYFQQAYIKRDPIYIFIFAEFKNILKKKKKERKINYFISAF